MNGVPYVVVVSEKDGMYELRVRELWITVRNADLTEAYSALCKRVRVLSDWANRIGLIELPASSPIRDLGMSAMACLERQSSAKLTDHAN